MARMSEREIVALVDAEFSTAMGAPDGEIAQERAELWDYYLSKPIGNEVEGQSQVVTSDVADIVDGIMPSLMRMFTTADNLVSFDPVGPEDIEQAELHQYSSAEHADITYRQAEQGGFRQTFQPLPEL